MLYIMVAAAIGLVNGCYLNTLEYRLCSEHGVITSDCYCPWCGAKLKLWEQIPILGYLLLRGRCRSCRAPIGIHYPLVELGSALLYAFMALVSLPIVTCVIGLIFQCLYVAVSVVLRRNGFFGGFGKIFVGALSLVWMAFISWIALQIAELL